MAQIIITFPDALVTRLATAFLAKMRPAPIPMPDIGNMGNVAKLAIIKQALILHIKNDLAEYERDNSSQLAGDTAYQQVQNDTSSI